MRDPNIRKSSRQANPCALSGGTLRIYLHFTIIAAIAAHNAAAQKINPAGAKSIANRPGFKTPVSPANLLEADLQAHALQARHSTRETQNTNTGVDQYTCTPHPDTIRVKKRRQRHAKSGLDRKHARRDRKKPRRRNTLQANKPPAKRNDRHFGRPQNQRKRTPRTFCPDCKTKPRGTAGGNRIRENCQTTL
jgi:hypothetical protein